MDHLGKPWSRSTRLAANLRCLADDLERIASGSGPTDLEIAFAPVLSEWFPCVTSAADPAIKGVVSGHPLIPDGERLYAEILAADPDLSWIRTWGGFYRLGWSALDEGEDGELRAIGRRRYDRALDAFVDLPVTDSGEETGL